MYSGSIYTYICRLANVASNESISSGSVAFQYWFNGPMDVPEGADPLSQLTMDCLDATTGVPQKPTCHLQVCCRQVCPQVHKGCASMRTLHHRPARYI